MRFIALSVFCLMIPITCFSQISSNPYVKLIENKTGKRLQLFAENTDSIPYMVFLRVTTQDYRRTSKRPILKEIPGNSKQLLKTLILLDGKEGNYTPTFIVNEVTTNLNMRKTHDDLDLKISEAKLGKTILIFTNSNCELCDQAISILEDNAFNFENLNITKDSKALVVLKKELGDKSSIESIEFPIIKIDNQLYKEIETRQQFIEILKEHFE